VPKEPNPEKEAILKKIAEDALKDKADPFCTINSKVYSASYDGFRAVDNEGNLRAFKPALCAQWLKENENFKTDYKSGILYYYDGKSWIANGEPYLEKILTKILGVEYRKSHYDNVLHVLKGLTYQQVVFSSKIATPTGLLDIETQTLTENTPEEMPLFAIPTEYVPNSPYPQWQAWLDDVMPNKDDQAMLQEWSGFILLPNYRFHKLLWNYGSGRNGKGVWERSIQATIGRQNCSEIGLEEFNGSHRFAMYQLYGKLFNTCSEPLCDQVLRTELLKKATGQDIISAERKGTDKRVDFPNIAKITVSANKFPKVLDNTVAFKQRRLFLNWTKEYLDSDGSQIQDIEKKWLQGEHDERKGILCWMLAGLNRLLSQGHFTESKSQKEIEILFLRASDTISAFKTEMLVFNRNLEVTRSEAYDAYKEYCDVFGLTAENEKRFTQTLKETPKVSITTVSKPKRERAWKGIGLKKLSEDEIVTDVTDVTLSTYWQSSEKNSLKEKESIGRVTSVTNVTEQEQDPEKSAQVDTTEIIHFQKVNPAVESHKCDNCHGLLAEFKQKTETGVIYLCNDCFKGARANAEGQGVKLIEDPQDEQGENEFTDDDPCEEDS
jgi:putative DNA primase/helicase